MRIAHVTATFPPYYGGTGMVCYYNALGLAQRGHQVTVYTAQQPGAQVAYPPEITVRCLPARFRLGNAPYLPELWQIANFDIVHLHYPFYFGAEILFLKSLANRRLKVVITYHQDVIFSGPLALLELLHHRLLGRHILQAAQRLLATSWDYARSSRLREFLQPPGKLDEMPNGVDATRFHPGIDPSCWRRHYRLAPGDQVVLFAGALDRAHYFKGVDVLLQALARIPYGTPYGTVKLLLVGDGDLRPRYQALAAELGLHERVIFCGRVSAADLPAHFALCDLLALPSTTRGEAFGLVLLEALACGKPVIASNLPGVCSVVAAGVDGLLVQPGDARDLTGRLQELLQDPARRQVMGERGRARVEARYAWPLIIPRLEQVYQEVLASGA